jgi:hypothetical protein
MCRILTCPILNTTSPSNTYREVSENRMLWRIFGPKREEVVGGCRRLQNEELRNLYVSPNVVGVMESGRMGWAGRVARMGELRNAYCVSVGWPGAGGGVRRFWRRRRGLCDDTGMDLGDMWWEVMDCIHLAQDGNRWWALVWRGGGPSSSVKGV